MESQRIDKWLWAARFFRTRSLASDALGKGRVQVNGVQAKASREVRPGDQVSLRLAQALRVVEVMGLSCMRGPAPVAQQLYREMPESLERLAREAERQRLAREPALSIGQGRPTKRDRRDMDRAWNDRWSASLD